MGENKGGHDHSNDGEKKKKKQGDGGKKDESKLLTVVFEVGVRSAGCGYRIIKAARGVAGVENAKVDCDKNQLTVVGEVYPVKLRDQLKSEFKKKKIELISQQPKQKEDQKTENEKPEGDKKGDENKSKEQKKPPPATTAVLKISQYRLYCQCDGCTKKIQNILSKIEKVDSISYDKQKDLVEVKGTMDVKSIRKLLVKMRKPTVKIVRLKKSDPGDDDTENNEIAPAGDLGWQARFNIIVTMIAIITFFWV